MRKILLAGVLVLSGCIFGGSGELDDDPTNSSNNANSASNNANNSTIANNENNTVNPPLNNTVNPPLNNTVNPPLNNTVNPPPNNEPNECPAQYLDFIIPLCELAAADHGRTPLSDPPPPPDGCPQPACPTCADGLRGMACMPFAYELTGAGLGAQVALSEQLLVSAGPGGPVTIADASSGMTRSQSIPLPTAGRVAVAGDVVAVTDPATQTVVLYRDDAGAAAEIATRSPADQLPSWGASIVGRASGDTVGFLIGAPAQNLVHALVRQGNTEFVLYDGDPLQPPQVVSLPTNAAYGAKIAANANGEVLAIMAPGVDTVFIHTYDENAGGTGGVGAWLPTGAAMASFGLELGSAVALNAAGTLLAIGTAVSATAPGGVELFALQGNTWQSVQTFDGSQVNAAASGRFGANVAIAGNAVYVAAPGDDQVAIFIGTPDLGYIPAGSVTMPSPAGTQFGASITVSSTRVAIGEVATGGGRVWVGATGNDL